MQKIINIPKMHFRHIKEEKKKVKKKMYITGDRGGQIKPFENDILLNNLDDGDYLFITGDFSFIFSQIENNMWEGMKLDLLARKPWITCFIDGNHENHAALGKYPVEIWKGGQVHVIRRSLYGVPQIIHLMRGEVYEIEGKKIFSFGGAYSEDSEYRIRNHNWWPELELPNKAEMKNGTNNLKKSCWKVDYILTHTLPAGVFKTEYRHSGVSQERDFRQYLEKIRKKCQFTRWYSGHIHLDSEIDEKNTSVLNCIRNIETNEIVGYMNQKKM